MTTRLRSSKDIFLNVTATLVALSGLITLSGTLFALTHLHKARIVLADAHLTVLAGLSLIYLAMTLRRGKHNAWLVSVVVYVYLLLRNIRHFVFDDDISRHYLLLIAGNLALPCLALGLLIIDRHNYKVRSSFVNFSIAARRSLIIIAIAFLYGVIGFQLFDKRDFHQEITAITAAHYTVDQFGLTTSNQPIAFTKRATFFVDSLTTISLASISYAALAFFSPVRFRLAHHKRDYADAENLVFNHAQTSEDFFKLWPLDKAYYFNADRTAAVAYRVSAGVALSVADPVGKKNVSKLLINEFADFCRSNDWRPAFIHTEKTYLSEYVKLGLDSQKIGEEAVVNIEKFVNQVGVNKYFRHINNKFSKAGYSFEVLKPPHSEKLMSDLEKISNDWLSVPGRSERGFMMGYFNEAYMQKCAIAIVKDPSGRIEAFLNQVPTCKGAEANYDFLRSRRSSLGNINDFVMMNFIKFLQNEGYRSLNMGLCPLSGLEESRSTDNAAINSILKFAYANGGRFYSFEGLKRFKSKYEPDWQPRYIVYQGGLGGFGLTMSALLRAMGKVN